MTDIFGILDHQHQCAISVCVVIASAAKQSILPFCGTMDCFAALAMTLIQFRILAAHCAAGLEQ
jgi:hypothetical protein